MITKIDTRVIAYAEFVFSFLALFNKLDLITLKVFKNNSLCLKNGLYINIFESVGQDAHYGRIAPSKSAFAPPILNDRRSYVRQGIISNQVYSFNIIMASRIILTTILHFIF